MAAGRQGKLCTGAGILLVLGLAATGCRSTPAGRALFGSRAGSAAASEQVVSGPGAAGETVAWRPARQRAAQGDLQAVSDAQGVPEPAGATPVAWRSRDGSVQFASLEQAGKDDKAGKDADKGGKDIEALPRPRPLVQGPVVLAPGLPVPMVPHANPVPRELHKMSLPAYTVEPPDILLVESLRGLPDQPVRGQHLVRPDGTISLGVYGSVYVTGMTLDQIRAAVAPVIAARLDPEVVAKNPVKPEDVNVDVLAYNSRVYYVITDGGGYGQQVVRIPVTGNETVLDAIAQINGLPAVSSKKHIWVARRTPGHGPDQILPVDWCGITQRGEAGTNYQIFPGDRVYVRADPLISIDTKIAKILSPIERLLGATLLGSETVNSIRNRGATGR